MGNISGTPAARALKFWVRLCLGLTTTLPKFGACATYSLEILKVRKTAKIDFNSMLDKWRSIRAMAKKCSYDALTWTFKTLCCSLLPLKRCSKSEKQLKVTFEKIKIFLKLKTNRDTNFTCCKIDVWVNEICDLLKVWIMFSLFLEKYLKN